MKYTTYYVAKGDLDVIRRKIKKEVGKAIIVYEQNVFFPFMVLNDKQDFWRKWDWLLDIFDIEGSGWGFSLYISGREVINAIYEKRNELYAELSDSGFKGDLEAAAQALGVDLEKLKLCLHEDGVEEFCQLVGFKHIKKLHLNEKYDSNDIILLK